MGEGFSFSFRVLLPVWAIIELLPRRGGDNTRLLAGSRNKSSMTDVKVCKHCAKKGKAGLAYPEPTRELQMGGDPTKTNYVCERCHKSQS